MIENSAELSVVTDLITEATLSPVTLSKKSLAFPYLSTNVKDTSILDSRLPAGSFSPAPLLEMVLRVKAIQYSFTVVEHVLLWLKTVLLYTYIPKTYKYY